MANGNMQGMGMMAQPNRMAVQEKTMPNRVEGPVVNVEAFKQKLETLSVKSRNTLEQHLTPTVKTAMAEIFGGELVDALKDIGPDEPTVNIPISIIADAYPAKNIETSIQMMGEDFASRGQKRIPSSPQGGLGEDPMRESSQTNVPPSTMPIDMG